MVRCTNKGCGQEFDPENNVDAGCVHHSGAPVSNPTMSRAHNMWKNDVNALRFSTKVSSPGPAVKV